VGVHARDQDRVGIAVGELDVPEAGSGGFHGVDVEERHEHVEADDARTELIEDCPEGGKR
jgi:hypothetical protein